jgi:hypothetical protein
MFAQLLMELIHATLLIIKLTLDQGVGNSERSTTLLTNGSFLSPQQTSVCQASLANPQPGNRDLLLLDRSKGGCRTCTDGFTGRQNSTIKIGGNVSVCILFRLQAVISGSFLLNCTCSLIER